MCDNGDMPTVEQRLYAEATKVPASRTIVETKELLRKHGCTSIYEAEEPDRVMVGFKFGNYLYRIGIEKTKGMSERDINRRWRVLAFTIKAKLISIAEEVSTHEQEFFHNIVMPDNCTLGERLMPQVAQLYLTGRMPTTLLLEAPKD